MLDRSLPAINGAASIAHKLKVCAILGISHAAVTDFQHVGIMPVARARAGAQVSIQVEDVHHAERAAPDTVALMKH